ncbi:hypothetical protein CLOM_g8759 [Closterium sp. NIES-68]|nr:hypothetical protein CLOM_g8759 [Closterium sp. NIES-68]GJP85260.1 hypothetical protein CLOP_g15377 [Closterium sp. NIES-67]
MRPSVLLPLLLALSHAAFPALAQNQGYDYRGDGPPAGGGTRGTYGGGGNYGGGGGGAGGAAPGQGGNRWAGGAAGGYSNAAGGPGVGGGAWGGNAGGNVAGAGNWGGLGAGGTGAGGGPAMAGSGAVQADATSGAGGTWAQGNPNQGGSNTAAWGGAGAGAGEGAGMGAGAGAGAAAGPPNGAGFPNTMGAGAGGAWGQGAGGNPGEGNTGGAWGAGGFGPGGAGGGGMGGAGMEGGDMAGGGPAGVSGRQAYVQAQQQLLQEQGHGPTEGQGANFMRDPPLSQEGCLSAVSQFVESMMVEMPKGLDIHDRKQEPIKDLLFFLHVPRTGGRTYHQCFLKPLFPVSLRCPRSYDELRFDPSKPQCRLLSTHDDYSLMAKLPHANTSVVSSMRDPVDRVLSAYEFTVEVASRSLHWVPSLNPGESLLEARRSARKRFTRMSRAETRRVWPWSLLIPIMEDDLWLRRNSTDIPPPPPGAESLNGYDKGYLVMPLIDYVNSPAVMDLIHNGATFHVAGITQNSRYPNARMLRRCASTFKDSGEKILTLAKAHLANMLHVGLTEVHEESAILFAATIGRSLHSAPHINDKPNKSPEEAQAEASITLLDHYKRCVDKQRARYTMRRSQAMGALGPLNFSHQERKGIRKEVVQRIRELNMLDSELLDFARQVFKQQQLAYADMIKAVMEEWPINNSTDDSHLGRRRRLSSSYASPGSSSSSRMFTRGSQVTPGTAATAAADTASTAAGVGGTVEHEESSLMLQHQGDMSADDGDDDGYGDDDDCLSYSIAAVAGQASGSL